MFADASPASTVFCGTPVRKDGGMAQADSKRFRVQGSPRTCPEIHDMGCVEESGFYYF